MVGQGDEDADDRHRSECEDNIKMDFRKSCIIWATFVRASKHVMALRFPLKVRKLLINSAIYDFLPKT
jgi:hypothetical protein